MELKDAIERRRTVRDFQKKDIPADIVEYAIENGFKAPTYNHLRDWDFIIVNSLESKIKLVESEELDRSINLNELKESFKHEDEVMQEMYLDAIPKQKKMILEAPCVIVAIFKPKTRVADATRIYDLNCIASIWACIENILLSLAENDVFGVPYIPQNIESIKEKLNIPNELEVAAVIPIGYKAENAKILKQKEVNIHDRMHFDMW